MHTKETKERKVASEEIMDIFLMAAEVNSLLLQTLKEVRSLAVKAKGVNLILQGVRDEQLTLFGKK